MTLTKKNIAKSAVWSLLSYGFPVVIGLIAIPVLVNMLGYERFAILTFIWLFVGYFNVFDLGIGRATTKLVSESYEASDSIAVAETVWGSIALLLFIGVLFSLLCFIGLPWLAENTLNIPENYSEETVNSFKIVALGIPLITVAAGFRGVLEAYQRFDLITIVRLPVTIVGFIAPILTEVVEVSLSWAVVLMLFSRMVAVFVYLIMTLRTVPSVRVFKTNWSSIKLLAVFSGWMSVSNIISPIMVYIDRFFIGALLVLASVTYYSTAYELITRLWLIPTALTAVIYPVFCRLFISNRIQATQFYKRTIMGMLFIMFPMVLVLVSFAEEGMTIWLNKELALHSAPILQILTFGVLINSIARIPFSAIQADGRPDITAKIHILEAPFYIFVLWLMVTEYGVFGAAITWVVRMIADSFLMFYFANRLLMVSVKFSGLIISLLALAGMGLYTGTIIDGVGWRIFYVCAVIIVLLGIGWFYLLKSNERDWVLKILSR